MDLRDLIITDLLEQLSTAAYQRAKWRATAEDALARLAEANARLAAAEEDAREFVEAGGQ